MHLKIITAALAALLLAACDPMSQLNEAEERIEAFHATYNGGDAHRLYGLTAEEFREGTSPGQMDELVALVSDRMGKVISTEREGININSEGGVTITTLTMKTTFEKGEATETFRFFGSGDEMGLVSWNVDSPNFAEPQAERYETIDIEAPPEG